MAPLSDVTPLSKVADLAPEHLLSLEVAQKAGQMLLDLRRRLAGGTDPATVRREGDRLSHEFIVRMLAEMYPEDPVVSEENQETAQDLRRRRIWIVDPLDGTREFAEPGRTDWAVHVALVVDGQPFAAAVALPARSLTLTANPAHRTPAPSSTSPRLVVSRTRPPAGIAQLAKRLGAEVIGMGSAGAKAMAVVLGEADIYLHAGGQYVWDSAAPVGVAMAAGLHVSRIDGSPIRYDLAGSWLPDQLICRPELADRVLDAVKECL